MILEIDAGNTFIKWRVLEQSGVRGKLLTAELSKQSIPERWQQKFSKIRVTSVAGKEVNLQLKTIFEALEQVEPLFAKTTAEQAGLTNSYLDPQRMGVDRWLAMLAAYKKAGGACCVVDCGSAITVDHVDEAGRHLGGHIIPGLKLMQKGLLENTSEILVDHSIKSFNPQPGRDTNSAVSNGIDFAFAALAKKIVDDLNVKHSDLYITGGDGELFHKMAGCGQLEPDLVLDGLAWALD